jgi:hypothetical protein
VIVSVALILPSTVAAEDKFTRLNEQQIRAKIVGKEITDRVHWGEYYRKDGVLISMDMGRKRVGSWKIDQNKLCAAKEKDKPYDCYEVWVSGSEVNLRVDENDTFVAYIEAHVPK